MGKRYILFLVEGETDQTALFDPIQNLLDEIDACIEVRFLEMKGDITSRWNHSPENIAVKMKKDHIDFFLEIHVLKAKDIYEIVQICDTDAVFIPDKNCKSPDESISLDRFLYVPPNIIGRTAEEVIERNKRKSRNLRYLSSINEIPVQSSRVPYRLCFFSANMDHCLHGKLNIDARHKIKLAEDFSDRCVASEAFFQELDGHAVPCNGLEESWRFIQKDLNSYERYSNLGIYLHDLVRRLKEERQD